MKVVIFAGGMGTRLSEETDVRPKPMVEIGGQPILWHVMKIYEHYGLNDFIICCGYKAGFIKDYFSNYFQRGSDVTFDFREGENKVCIHKKADEQWRVTLVDTGKETQTGGRLLRIRDYIDDDEDFCLTYGDGVADVDIKQLVDFHKKHGKVATVTAVQPVGRFGMLNIEDNTVSSFIEKPIGDGAWINGGFFVLKKSVFDYIPDGADQVMWEAAPMHSLAQAGQLQAYKHKGFWQPMDTLREKHYLDDLCQSGKAPWAVWDKY